MSDKEYSFRKTLTPAQDKAFAKSLYENLRASGYSEKSQEMNRTVDAMLRECWQAAGPECELVEEAAQKVIKDLQDQIAVLHNEISKILKEVEDKKNYIQNQYYQAQKSKIEAVQNSWPTREQEWEVILDMSINQFKTKLSKAAALKEDCVASDSGLTVAKCWCADCKDRRSEIRKGQI